MAVSNSSSPTGDRDPQSSITNADTAPLVRISRYHQLIAPQATLLTSEVGGTACGIEHGINRLSECQQSYHTTLFATTAVSLSPDDVIVLAAFSNSASTDIEILNSRGGSAVAMFFHGSSPLCDDKVRRQSRPSCPSVGCKPLRYPPQNPKPPLILARQIFGTPCLADRAGRDQSINLGVCVVQGAKHDARRGSVFLCWSDRRNLAACWTNSKRIKLSNGVTTR